MNLTPDMTQALVYVALFVGGIVLKHFFPGIKLPLPVAPANPASPTPLRDELASILPGLLAGLLQNRLPALPVAPAAAVTVSTPTHDIGVNAAGAVNVAVK